MARSVFIWVCFAILATSVVTCRASRGARLSEELHNVKGTRRPLFLRFLEALLRRLAQPNGYSIEFGIGLEAEVDDIEAGLDIGPFGFTLDDIPEAKEEKKEEKAEEKAEEKKPACDEYCDQYTGTTCCMDAQGICTPNGGTCQATAPSYYPSYGYPSTYYG